MVVEFFLVKMELLLGSLMVTSGEPCWLEFRFGDGPWCDDAIIFEKTPALFFFSVCIFLIVYSKLPKEGLTFVLLLTPVPIPVELFPDNFFMLRIDRSDPDFSSAMTLSND